MVTVYKQLKGFGFEDVAISIMKVEPLFEKWNVITCCDFCHEYTTYFYMINVYKKDSGGSEKVILDRQFKKIGIATFCLACWEGRNGLIIDSCGNEYTQEELDRVRESAADKVTEPRSDGDERKNE